MGRYLAQWYQHELAFFDTRVRDGKLGLLAGELATDQDININGARAVFDSAFAAQLALDVGGDAQQLSRAQAGFHANSHIQEAGLVGEAYRCCFIDR